MIDVEKEESKLEWNPEEARDRGTLKADIELKTNAKIDSVNNLEVSEPKKKVKKRTSVTVVDLSKNKNKNSLF